MPPLSEAEWKVMQAIWTRRGPATAREVCDALAADTGWAYTTVKTVMDRLVEKGALDAAASGHVRTYRARLSRPRAISDAARTLARRAFGGALAPLVHHLVREETLSASDRAELRRMLDEAERTAGTGGSRTRARAPRKSS